MENVIGEFRSGSILLEDEDVDLLLASSDVLKEMVYNVSNSENVDIGEIKVKLTEILEKASNSKGKNDDSESPKLLEIKKKSRFNIDGLNYTLIKDSIRYGHRVYEISLNMNGDLLDYEEGPIKLFNSIQSIGMLVDMKMDYSKINSLEDVLKALDDENFDVKLDILMTTVLDKKLLAGTLDIIEENIIELTEIDDKVEVKKHIEENKVEGKGVLPRKVINEDPKENSKEISKENIEKKSEGKSAAKKREAEGKARTGIIKLRAYHECGAVNIDIIDDGKGMDAEKIKNSALEKGVLGKAELDAMSEQDIIKLIFRPGFSTARKLTDVSGRGVGMDVVKTNIEKLGGSVEIFTVIGEGTTVRLILPLTLAIVQSLVVATCGHRFIIPQVDVQEIVRINDDDSKKIEFVQNAEVFRLRGKLIPIVHLSKVLNIDKEESQENGIRVLIIRQGKRLFGLAVEDVLGSEETLVKPVPPYLKDCMAYSGVTILGDGKTAMIIDSEGIVKISDLKFLDNNDAFSDDEANQSNLNETQNLLLFKCSGNELYALDIAMVSRIEKIKISEIETIGNKMYVNHRGNSLRIIKPEDYLDVTGGALSGEYAYIIIPKLVKHPMGILTSAIHDNIKVSLKLDNQEIKMNGLIGSSIYQNKIMLIINIYELFEMADPERNETIQYDYRKGKSVLIVEDTPFFQQMTQNYLLGAGYEVYLANNGREALDLLGHSMVDVVISDVQMPVMDGYEFVKRMKESTALSHIPVIAVTSMTGEYNKSIGLEKGFDYYEYKLDRDRLLKVIDIAIGG